MIENSELPGSSTALGYGLRGYYYTNIDMTALAAVRDDATVSFTNLTSSSQLPAGAYPKTNQISIRWLGQVLSTVAGAYTFATTCDDGSRLWVNGRLLVDNWTLQSASAKSGSVALAANTRYDLVLEYFHNTGSGSAILSWMPPGDTTTNVIPANNLFLPGPGKLVKTGAGFTGLSGINTYSGGAIVAGGLLEISSDGGLGNGNVTVSNATLQLDPTSSNAHMNPTNDLLLQGASPALAVVVNFSGPENIHALSFDGGVTYVNPGTYGPVGSSATYQTNLFTGTAGGYFNVSAGPSANVLASSANPAVYGSSLTFTSTITGSGATPTGTVTFYDGASAIGAATLNGSGVATLTVSKLSVAASPHSITAIYSGDANYAASTSSALSQPVSATTLSVVVAVANKVYDGTTSATITNLAIAGVASGDTPYVRLTGTATAAFLDKNAGANKTVTVNVTGLALAGSLSGDYTLPGSMTTNANIAARPITVTAVTDTKPYDGTTNSAGAPTITSGTLTNSDTVTWTQSFDSPNVGARILTPAGTVSDNNGGAELRRDLRDRQRGHHGDRFDHPADLFAQSVHRDLQRDVHRHSQRHERHSGGDRCLRGQWIALQHELAEREWRGRAHNQPAPARQQPRRRLVLRPGQLSGQHRQRAASGRQQRRVALQPDQPHPVHRQQRQRLLHPHLPGHAPGPVLCRHQRECGGGHERLDAGARQHQYRRQLDRPMVGHGQQRRAVLLPCEGAQSLLLI